MAESFGAWVRQRRKEYKDWTQARLAEEAGCSFRTIQEIEAGRLPPKRALAERIAAKLEMSPADRRRFFDVNRLVDSLPTVDSAAGVAAGLIPLARTPLLGRAQEVAEAQTLLARPHVRLLTLTGAGGIGKTRLALQIAGTFQAASRTGVHFVDLSPIRDPDLVTPAIAEALHVQESSSRKLVDSLKEYLRPRRLLLVLDNFEQILAAAGLLTDLLDTAPDLTILITSREVLRIEYEREFPVPPLAVPTTTDPANLAASPAVQLFVDRAQAAELDFALTTETAPVVAAICARLDGLPLAIELAAARVGQFSPPALLARLDKRLALLTGGPRDQPHRHQTLRATIAWSYDLLDPGSRQLFTRLAVFAGGATLDAVEAICPSEGRAGAATDLNLLTDKSLLQQFIDPTGMRRYRMLETIREYALEQLADGGDAPAVEAGHATYYLYLAEQAAPRLAGAQPAATLLSLETDHDNLRAVLRWALDNHQVQIATQLAVALWRFWQIRCHWTEGRHWLAEVLQRKDAGPLRAALLAGAGQLAEDQSDHGTAEALLTESLTLYRAQNDQRGMATTLSALGMVARARREPERAAQLMAESLALWRQLGDPAGLAQILTYIGGYAGTRHRWAEARRYHEESLKLFRQLEDTASIAAVLYRLAMSIRESDDPQVARPYYEESLAICRELGDRRGVANAQIGLARVAWLAGDYDRARDLYDRCLIAYQEIEYFAGIGSVLTYKGQMLTELAEHLAARALLAQAIELCEKHNAVTNRGDALLHIGATYRGVGDLVRAQECYQQSYEAYAAAFRGKGWPTGLAASSQALAEIAIQMDDIDTGTMRYRESLRWWQVADDAPGLVQFLLSCLDLALKHNCIATEVVLWQALMHRWDEVAPRLEPPHRNHYDQLTTALRGHMEAPFVLLTDSPDLEQVIEALLACLQQNPGLLRGGVRLMAAMAREIE